MSIVHTWLSGGVLVRHGDLGGTRWPRHPRSRGRRTRSPTSGSRTGPPRSPSPRSARSRSRRSGRDPRRPRARPGRSSRRRSPRCRGSPRGRRPPAHPPGSRAERGPTVQACVALGRGELDVQHAVGVRRLIGEAGHAGGAAQGHETDQPAARRARRRPGRGRARSTAATPSPTPTACRPSGLRSRRARGSRRPVRRDRRGGFDCVGPWDACFRRGPDAAPRRHP